jgi:hypothetical protein
MTTKRPLTEAEDAPGVKRPLKKGEEYVRLLNTSMTHRNFRYSLGLNVDGNPFTHGGMTGLYFVAKEGWYQHYSEEHTLVADVEVPEDAQVTISNAAACEHAFRADKLILKNIRSIHAFIAEHTDEELLPLVSYLGKTTNTYVYNLVPLSRTVVWKQLLSASAKWLQLVLTRELYEFGLAQHPEAMAYVPRSMLDTSLCMVVIKNAPTMIQHVADPTHALCLEAVKHNGNVLGLIPEVMRTEKLCVAAALQQGELVPGTPDMHIEAVKKALPKK